MDSNARIVAALDEGGRTRLRRLSGEGALTVRPTGTPEAARVHLVAGAFGPLGGDVLTLEVDVEEGAALDVAGVAASVAQRSRDGRGSQLRVRVRVAQGARLRLVMAPTVVTDGAHHTLDTRLFVAAGGSLLLREETVRGRTGESGGIACLRSHLDVDGHPVLRQEVELCGPVGGPWRPRAVASLLVIGTAGATAPPLDVAEPEGVRAAWMALPRGAGHQLNAMGDDPLLVRRLLARQLPR